MILFPSIGRYGRLGNQLFQYAAGRSLAINNNTELFIHEPLTSEWHGQKCLLNNFNIQVTHTPISVTRAWKEKDPFIIEQDFWHLPDNIFIDGFFQSIYYFESFQQIIKQELTPKKLTSTFIENIRSTNNKPIVSIHVRRGDNVDGTDGSQTALRNMYNKDGIYEQYINEAISYFGNVNFAVFSGGKRWSNDNSDDISWCKRFFKGDNYFFSESRSPIEDLCGIILCDHNIISHVSSFGWWGAYLNSNKNKKVIAPMNYHPDIPNFTHRHKFYPNDWSLM